MTTGYKSVSRNSPSQMKSALESQPLSVSIEADKSVFQLYKSGVIDSKGCGTKLDHGVLEVGYGSQDGQDYRKVKNSGGGTGGMVAG